MNPATIVVISVYVAGAAGPSAALGAAQTSEAIREAGGRVAEGSIKGLYDGQASELDVADVGQALQRWGDAVKAATDLYYEQRYPQADRTFAEAASAIAELPQDVLIRLRRKFAEEWVSANLTWARAQKAQKRESDAEQTIRDAAKRFPAVSVSDAQFPAEIVAGFDAARRELRPDRPTGALDIGVQWSGDPRSCTVSVGSIPVGFPPARVDDLTIGRLAVVALCPKNDGRTLLRSRPVWVDIQPRRTQVRLVIGGDSQLLQRPEGIGILGVAGWSTEPRSAERAAHAATAATAALAAMARTGAKGAIVVGVDPAVSPDRLVLLQFGDGPPIALEADEGDTADSRDPPGHTWLWWVAGGLVAGGWAWDTQRDFEDCRGEVDCAGADRFDDLADRVGERALTADLLLGAGLVAAAVATALDLRAPAQGVGR